VVIGHGVDIVEISRIEKTLSKYGDAFLNKYFGDAEVKASKKYKNPSPFIASRFAAKEAFSKALGTGFTGFGFKDVVVLRDEGKPPRFSFSKNFKKLFPDVEEKDFLLSISHEKSVAIASVIRSVRDGDFNTPSNK